MVFPGGASMQQHSPLSVGNDYGYGSVPQSIPMRLELGCRSDRNIIDVDDDHFI
jgi:hypothetical protein